MIQQFYPWVQTQEQKTYGHTLSCTQMFIAALLIIARK